MNCMKTKPLDETTLLALANRAVRRYGPLPKTVSIEDAVQDAVMTILEWHPYYDPRTHNCERDAYLVMKAWGTLKDKYEKDWKHQYSLIPTKGPDPSNRDSPGEETVYPTNPQSASDEPHSLVEASTDDEQERLDAISDCQEAIAKLPRREQRAIRLSMNGDAYHTIATKMRISASEAAVLVRSAKAKLAEYLKAYDPEDK